MYRIYGQNKLTGWEKIDTKKELKEIHKIAETLKPKGYYSYMIIQNNGKGDEVIEMKNLYEECEVEYIDEVKTDFEVKAMIFRESLKVIEQEIEQTKVDVRTDKELTNEQKREQLKGLDRLNQIEEIMRRRNEDAWYK